MRHGWLLDCSLELIQASSVVARYRKNLPTFSAGTSPRFAIRSSTFGWIFRTRDASLLVRSVSISSDMQLITSQVSYDSMFVPHKMVSCSITESTLIPILLDLSPLKPSTRAHKLRSLPRCSEQIPVLPSCVCPCHPIDLICRTIFSVKRLRRGCPGDRAAKLNQRVMRG